MYEGSEPWWVINPPTPAVGAVRLCLASSGRLAVVDDGSTELAVLFKGASAPLQGAVAAYVQVR